MALLNIGVENLRCASGDFPRSRRHGYWKYWNCGTLFTSLRFASLVESMWDPQHKPSPGVKALKQTTGDGVSLWIRDWILALLLLLGFFYWGAVPTTGVSCCGSRACIYIYIHMFDDDIFAWWFHHEKKGHLLDDDLYYVFRGWNHQFHGDFRIPMIQHPASASVPVTSPHQGWERSHGSGQSQRHLRDIFLDYFSRFFYGLIVWLVVSNMNFIFHFICGIILPNWFSYVSEGWLNHQASLIVILVEYSWDSHS